MTGTNGPDAIEVMPEIQLPPADPNALLEHGKLPNTGTQMSAWSDDHLTEHQKGWVNSEALMVAHVIKKLGSHITIADIGCGDSRILHKLRSHLAPFGKYVGFDNESATILGARNEFSSQSNVEFPDADDYAVALLKYVEQHGLFDLVMCLGNTLGTLGGDRTAHVLKMAATAKTLVISVVRAELDVTLKRLEYYGKPGNQYNCHIDWQTHTIESKQWGKSLAWSSKQLDDLASQCKSLGFVRHEIVKAEPLGYLLIISRR